MEDNVKKILVVDDSALMRRVLCDIINSDKRFQVAAKAVDGVEAFDLLSRDSFDAVVLDINMPRMNGLELLAELRKFKIRAKIMIASTDSGEGAAVTMDALELGALDFIQKPGSTYECRSAGFMTNFLDTLYAVSIAQLPAAERVARTAVKPQTPPGAGARRPRETVIPKTIPVIPKPVQTVKTTGNGSVSSGGMQTAKPLPAVPKGTRKAVAIASSTGGPRALQSVIPLLPKDLDAPVLLVQHMPKGFTASLAERLDTLSEVKVVEAKDGDVLEKGVVYIAMGGMHMNVKCLPSGVHVIYYSDEPTREGVKPSANYMYESLRNSKFSDILCVVMTGMGADGTEGIKNLKQQKNIEVFSQTEETCVVYGMPKSVVKAGLSDQAIPLQDIAGRITQFIGLKKN